MNGHGPSPFEGRAGHGHLRVTDNTDFKPAAASRVPQIRHQPLRTGEAAMRELLRPVTFWMIGARNEPRGRLVSTRPVSRCAISRNVRVVRCFAESSAIIWPLFAAVPNSRESNGIEAIG